jgi:hypothetical protein
MSTDKELSRLWGMPVLLGMLTAFGLLAALLGTGIWQWLAWPAIAAPIAVIVRHVFRPRARAASRKAGAP